MRISGFVSLIVTSILTISCSQAKMSEPFANFRPVITNEVSKVSFFYDKECNLRAEWVCIRLYPAITEDTVEPMVAELRKWFEKRNRGIADWGVYLTTHNLEGVTGVKGISVETFQLK